MVQFSVLMSLYKKEKAAYAEACFESLLAQTVPASEWVIVEDGPLTEELYELLVRYEKEYPGMIHRVPLKENRGLGLALQAGVPECTYDLIARMDTDDIARQDRFEKQLAAFEEHPELSVLSSRVDEFETDPAHIVASRWVPLDHEEIVQYQKRRDGFNHMAVMYRKEAVLRAGNYQSCPLMEDTLLWVHMIQTGARCMNLDEPLVYARIGRDMYERRGGWSYFKKYREGRKMVLATGYISKMDYLETIAVQLVVCMMPNKLRGWLFRKVLHKEA